MSSLRIVVGLALVWAAGGCGVTVEPPHDPPDAVAVYFADFGVHSSVLLPVGERRYVEYVWGDWGYAVENRRMVHNAVGALFLSSQSAFGRRYLESHEDGGEPKIPEKNVKVVRFEAERRRVAGIVDELGLRFDAGEGPPVVNPRNNLAYVRDPRRYSIADNCNDLTVHILTALGCRISGSTVSSNFRFVGPRPR